MTDLLELARAGDRLAFSQVFPLLYGELRRLAQSQLEHEGPGHTLQGTALVHEAYLKLAGQDRAEWKNREQFLAIAAQAMRRILVDHARRKKAAKREAAFEDRLKLPGVRQREDLEALDDALSKLEASDARKARVVELRFFGGLTEAETATCLGISLATVQRDWNFARAWLFQEIQGQGGAGAG